MEIETATEENSEQQDPTILDLIGAGNIAEQIEGRLEEISQSVLQGYAIDKSSRSHREEKMEKAMDLAMQTTKTKNFPWPNASNVIYPLITIAAMRFAERMYPAVIVDNEVAKGKIIGNDDGVEQPVIDPNTNQPVIDPNTGQPATQIIGKGAKQKRADRKAKYVNHQLSETMPNWEEDTDRLLHVMPITGCVFRKMYHSGKKPESAIILPKHFIVNYNITSLSTAPRITCEIELYPYEIEERIRDGRFIDFEYGVSPEGSQGDEDAAHLFYVQCRRIDLDGDGYPEPYIVTYHKATGKTVSVVANFQEDGIKVNDQGQIQEIRPEEYYVKYGMMPAFDGGFYDMGFGEIMFSLNKSVNTLLNQLIDSGTLANAGGGLIGRGIRMKGGAIRNKIGEYQQVDTRGMALRENIYQFQHPEPSLVLFQLLGLLIEAGKDIGANKDALTGEQTGNISGVTQLSLVEQGLTAFKAIYKRTHRSIKKELGILYRMNSLYLDEQEYLEVVDDPEAIAADWEKNEIAPISDPTMISDMQKLGKAQILMEFKDDPLFDPTETRERILDAANIASEGLLVEPNPQPDPALELVKGQIENERAKLEIENFKASILAEKTVSEIDKRVAEINKLVAETLKALAEAEGVEKGTQLETYKTELERINEENRIRGVEAPPANAGVQEVPQQDT